MHYLRREMIRHDMCHILIWTSPIYMTSISFFSLGRVWKNLSKMLLRLSFSFISSRSTLSHVAVSRDDCHFSKTKINSTPVSCNKNEMKFYLEYRINYNGIYAWFKIIWRWIMHGTYVKSLWAMIWYVHYLVEISYYDLRMRMLWYLFFPL